MYTISKDLIYLIRAILFGVVVGYAIMAFFYYFKPFIDNTFNVKTNTDIWWYTGIAISVIAGILAFALLM